jgi:hypothetical protein
LREAADLLDAQAARLERAEQEEEYLRHKADDFERRLEQAEQALREIAGKHYAGVYWDGTPTGPDAVAALQEIARAALAVGHGVAADTKAET